MTTEVKTASEEKRQAITWLRGVLIAILDTASLPEWAKKRAMSITRRLPDWCMAKWATALSIDYMSGYRACPDLAEKAHSDTGRRIIHQYLEAHTAIPAVIGLRRLVPTILRHFQEGKLPVDKEVVEHQVCALAWSACTADGMEFAEKARSILSRGEPRNHLLTEYQVALKGPERERLDRLDEVLTSVPYGRWVAERLDEAKRWLGLDTPRFHIQHGQRTPLWELLWQRIFTGGDTHEQ